MQLMQQWWHMSRMKSTHYCLHISNNCCPWVVFKIHEECTAVTRWLWDNQGRIDHLQGLLVEKECNWYTRSSICESSRTPRLYPNLKLGSANLAAVQNISWLCYKPLVLTDIKALCLVLELQFGNNRPFNLSKTEWLWRIQEITISGAG